MKCPGRVITSDYLGNAISAIKSTTVPLQTLSCRKRPAAKPIRTMKKKKKTNSLSNPSVVDTLHAHDLLQGVEAKLCSVFLKEDDAGATEHVDGCNVTSVVCGYTLAA